MQIVYARAEMTGLTPTGRYVTRDRNYFPEFKVTPQARAGMWLNNGTAEDAAKARASLEGEGYRIFIFGQDERDPLGKAKAAVLKDAGK